MHTITLPSGETIECCDCMTSYHCPNCGRPSSEIDIIGHYEPEPEEIRAFPMCAGETLRCSCGKSLRWIDMVPHKNKIVIDNRTELNKATNKLTEEVYKALKLKEICNKLEQLLSRFQRKRKC